MLNHQENQTEALQTRQTTWPELSLPEKTVKLALTHNSPNIQTLAKIDPKRLFAEISIQCFNFLKINSSGDKFDLISSQFADLVIRTRSDWKLPEVKMFFDTIIERQDLPGFKVFGNYINPLKLSEMLCEYENLRCDEREKLMKERQEPISYDRPKIDEKGISTIKKIVHELSPAKKMLVNHASQESEKVEYQEKVYQIDHNSMNKKIQGWMMEFDSLAQEAEDENTGQRTVFVDKKKMTCEEFLQHKLNPKADNQNE